MGALGRLAQEATRHVRTDYLPQLQAISDDVQIVASHLLREPEGRDGWRDMFEGGYHMGYYDGTHGEPRSADYEQWVEEVWDRRASPSPTDTRGTK